MKISDYGRRLADSLRKHLITDEVELLTKNDIQQIFDSLSSSYKAKTLRSMCAVADAAFRMAVSKGQVNSNPFVGVMIGRIEEHKCYREEA